MPAQQESGGLIFLRRITPLPRRNAVYFYSALDRQPGDRRYHAGVAGGTLEGSQELACASECWSRLSFGAGLADAIQRAGSLDPEKVNDALAKTDMKTIVNRVKFNADHFNYGPVMFFGQWFKTDTPEKFELKIVYSANPDFAPASAPPIFPMPYGK